MKTSIKASNKQNVKFKRSGRKTFKFGTSKAICQVSDDGNLHVYAHYVDADGRIIDDVTKDVAELGKLMIDHYRNTDFTLWSW